MAKDSEEDKAWDTFLRNKSEHLGHQLWLGGEVVGLIIDMREHKGMDAWYMDVHVRTATGTMIYSVNMENSTRHPRRAANGIVLVFSQRNHRYLSPTEGTIMPN